MASVKNLKKNINLITGELFSECLFCRLYLPGSEPEKADQIMVKILDMQDEFLSRCCHPNGERKSALMKRYYKKLADDFRTAVEAIIEDIQKMNK